MGTFDSFIRRRLRAILRAQQKRPGHGRCLRDHMEWPNAYFANLGLFTMKEARALEVASQCNSSNSNSSASGLNPSEIEKGHIPHATYRSPRRYLQSLIQRLPFKTTL